MISMNFISVLEKMIELFLIIIVGYGAYKIKFIDGGVKIALTKLILNIICLKRSRKFLCKKILNFAKNLFSRKKFCV